MFENKLSIKCFANRCAFIVPWIFLYCLHYINSGGEHRTWVVKENCIGKLYSAWKYIEIFSANSDFSKTIEIGQLCGNIKICTSKKLVEYWKHNTFYNNYNWSVIKSRIISNYNSRKENSLIYSILIVRVSFCGEEKKNA